MSGPARELVVLLVVFRAAYAPWGTNDGAKRLVLDVGFETARDYDITSASAFVLDGLVLLRLQLCLLC